jgi:hypothetical protein
VSRTSRLLSPPIRPLAAALFIAAFPGVAAADPVPRTATLVNIATDATDPTNRDDSEPSIAVNPKNPLEVAVVAFSEKWDPNDPKKMAPVWKSADGGQTWRKVFQIPRPQPGFAGPGDQKVAFDKDGRLYVAQLGSHFTPKNFIYRQAAGPDDPLTPGAIFGDDQPMLDVDASSSSKFIGRAYSAWLNFGVTGPQSTLNRSTDGGATVADAPVAPLGFPNRTTRTALARDGTAYAVYKTREGAAGANFEKAHFRVARSDDGGETWAGLGAAGVSIHGAAQVETFFTNTFGNTAKGKVARARSSDAWIAVHPVRGDVVAAYVSKDASGFGQIYVARSTDRGATWQSKRVTDGKNHSAYPEIAVAANGAVGVLYVDYDDAGAKTIFRHRFARSFDDTATWTDQVLQSMDPEPLVNAADGFLWGDYEGLTAHGDTFYGVFTGESIGRTEKQLDPIFFRETAVNPNDGTGPGGCCQPCYPPCCTPCRPTVVTCPSSPRLFRRLRR